MDDITQSLIDYKSGLVGIWLLLMLVSERLAPAVERLGGWGRIMRNAGLWAANIGLYIAIVVPLSCWAANVAWDWRPVWLMGWLGLLFDIVILDFMIYWWHRANHVFPLLWRFHQVHHLDQFLDATSSVRFHFGEVLLSAFFRACVILVLGIPMTSVLVFEAMVLAAAAFHHSNMRLHSGLEGAIACVFITPSIHWVHHHAMRADTDSNYGTLFSLWDRSFRSKSSNPRRPDMAMGVEAREDEGFLALLVIPFRGWG